MPVYDTYPAVDENYEFPPEIKNTVTDFKGVIPSIKSEDVPSGIYMTSSASMSYHGIPLNGTLIINKSKTSVAVYWIIISEEGILQRYHGSAGWQQWKPVTDEHTRKITAGTDWNTLIERGEYQRVYASDDPNSPNNSTGTLVNFDSLHPNGIISSIFISYAGNGIFYRSQNSSSVFSPWVRLDQIPNAQSAESSRKDYVRSSFRERRGGTIGTGGLAAVGLRFDHHTDSFKAKVYPKLKELNLPWAQALNPANVGSGDDQVTYTELQNMCIDTGGEIYNHGRNHQDAINVGQLNREIITSLNDLRTNLPAISVEGWMPPGVGNGGYMGFSGFETEDQYATVGGGMVLSRHGAIHGYKTGIYRCLDGANPIGHAHTTLDTQTLSQAQGIVNGAIATTSGVIFMLHSNYLDQTGYMTTSTLNQILDWIAAQRDAGRIEVLTPSGILLADAGSSYRRNLINVPAGTSSSTITQNIAITRADQRGVPHELKLTASLPSNGTVSVKAVFDSPRGPRTVTTTHSLLAAKAKTTRSAFTIPLDATSVQVEISFSTPTMKHLEPQLHAV